ncbi:MAG: efflux RND transporter periplasmic adaptor subunit [Deltaproteobacteria bacterium]|nr:efflux RND transporter periplasmic adaptor subunit [Deltaproteobacteria bacterium]
MERLRTYMWTLRPNISRWRFLLLALLLAGALMLFFFSGCKDDKKSAEAQEAKSSEPPTMVVVTKVIQQTVPIYLDFVARTEAKATVDIKARVEGVLERQVFTEGTNVKKDQLLYVIDRRPYEAKLQSSKAKLASAKAAIDQAKANLNKAKLDVARLTPLAKQDAVPQQDLDTAVAKEQTSAADLAQAHAGVDEAKAAVIQDELNLGYCTIRSPLDGLIGRTKVNVGNLVGRNETTLLATISSTDPIWVTFAISEASYLYFAKKEDVEGPTPPVQMVLADNSPYPYKGKTIIGDRAVDVKTGTISLVAEFPNPKGLIRPGQFARVRIPAEQATDALLIPQRAVSEQQNAKIVYVVTADNKVALRTVVLGDRYENMFIVKEGVKAGERVIVEGLLKARPGAVVKPTDKPMTEEKKGQ